MQPPPFPPDEQQRQAALDSFRILDSPSEQSFDMLVEAAQAHFGAGFVVISLVDRDRQWFKACHGGNFSQTSRDISFCGHVILEPRPMVVPDALLDPRFADNPLVTGAPFIRLYAGAPLITPGGHRIGTFCLFDSQPGNLTAEQIAQLERFARLAMLQIELRQKALRASEAEAAARTAEQRFHTFMDNSPAIAFIKDAEGRFTYTNRCFQESYHRMAESFIGLTTADVWPPEFAQVVLEHDRQVLSTRQTTAFTEKVPGPEGQIRTFYTMKFPFRNEAGEWLLGGVAVDLTERETAEEALRLSEERWQLALHANNDGIWDWDARTDSLFQSSRWWEMLGYNDLEASGSAPRWDDLLHSDDAARVKQELQEYLDERSPNYSVEYRLRAADGSYRWVLARGKAVWDDRGRPLRMVGSHTDVTARKELEAELQRNQMQLEQRNKALEIANTSKSELLSRMSHEFRTPLNAIIGFSQLLRELTQLTPEQTEYVEEILKGGQYLLGLINELLDMVRIEAGKLAMTIEAVDPANPLREAMDLVRPLAADKHVQIEADLSPIQGRCVLVDYQRLLQVILNLLSNAIKYNKNHGRVSIRGEAAANSRITLAFTDTGIGIPADKMHRLFSPFDRLGAEQYGIEGTGLGLAVTKRLVEAMSGTLSVESTDGAGSVFAISFPAGQSPREREQLSHSSLQAIAEPVTQSATVLYIEDNLANVKLVQKILSKRPAVKLLTALKGALGVELAREHQPDCILLDVHLPDMPGSQVMERLHSRVDTAAIPVVVLSADATESQRQRLLSLGARGYLTKPLDVVLFLNLLDSVLAEV